MLMPLNAEGLMQRWREQIDGRRQYRRARPLAALGCLYRAEESGSPLVELRRLTLVVLFDEPIGHRLPAIRVVGYGASQAHDGVQWGGPDNCRFYKDLRMEPVDGGSGLQVDLSNHVLLHLALQLRAAVYRLDRFCPKAAGPGPQLPRLWAGFSPEDGKSLHGGGPELAALCEKFGMEPDAMLRKFQYEHRGLCCFPLEWVSANTARSLAIFADLREMPKTQVFRLPSIPDGLQGFQGAAAYDFFNSPLREMYAKCLERKKRRAAESGSDPTTPSLPMPIPIEA